MSLRYTQVLKFEEIIGRKEMLAIIRARHPEETKDVGDMGISINVVGTPYGEGDGPLDVCEDGMHLVVRWERTSRP